MAHQVLKYRTRIEDYQMKFISNFIYHFKDEINPLLPGLFPSGFSVATCTNCQNISLWVNQEMIYPKKTNVDPPNEDMNKEIQELYVEASNIVLDSPKGATALFRLALQLLLKQIGKTGKNINEDIKNLVYEGLSPKIQQALDLLRVVGNKAVHPGQINLNNNKEIALKLFSILNFIAEEMISKPKQLDLLYSGIVPEDTKQHIRQRDGQ